MADLVGRTIDRYRIVSKLGRGGMAEVYKAYQPALKRYVAIKFMLSHMADDKEFLRRFIREAENTAKLRHPNIVTTYDFHSEGDRNFMVMEFIEGPTLKSEIKARHVANSPFSLKEIASVFTALCNAVDYAHSRGMVHRDIKPANVMINQDGQVVLTDFGIVRTVDGTQHTITGALTGTPAYMSPEQGEGKKADERSDIYALGIMLYEMVTGAVPYDADTPFAVIMKHIRDPLPMPSKVKPDLPEAVEKVILKAMAKSPDDRYQTAGALAEDLRAAVGLTLREANQPIPIVAPPPKTQDIPHDLGPITEAEKAATMASLGMGGEATVVSSVGGEQTVASPPPVAAKQGLPMVPLAIGGAVIVILLIAAIFLFSGINSNGAEATAQAEASAAAIALAEAETAEAARNATATAAAAANAAAAAAAAAQATATREAELAAPTQTAQAEINAALTATADAERITGIIGGVRATDQAATAEAEAAAAAAAETATAEFLANVTDTPVPSDTPTPGPTNTPAPVVPTDTATPDRPSVSGKLAFPVDNGAGAYDVQIVSLPNGSSLGTVKLARQPNFRLDGLTLLVNGQGSGGFSENVFETSGTGALGKIVSSSPTDMHPFYKPDGTTLTYGNPQLAFGSEGYQPYIFVQCGLIPPNQDPDEFCADIAGSGVLVPAGQVGDILGSNPVWTGSDLIAYKGCDTWGRGGGGSCGIYIVGSWANKRSSNGENPRKVVDGGSTIPTDSKAGLIAYHGRESGDWEAYVVSEGGGGAVNISNSPNSSDGLPTISPDGNWVAFASDRDGGWAVFVAPSSGGSATKLFDFPKANPWATGDRDWTTERMSWGP